MRLVSLTLASLAIFLMLATPLAAQTTERVSVDSIGRQGNGSAGRASISGDARFVAFDSLASNLVEGDTNGVNDIFVHDRRTDVTTRVSVDSSGVQGNGSSGFGASISGDGLFIAFGSEATNLVEQDTNNVADVFVHDRQTGEITRVSVDSTGEQGTSSSSLPSISADGRFVAFTSSSPELAGDDSNQTFDVFVHDRNTGETTRVSVDSTGAEGNDMSCCSSISGGGRFVAFASQATNLVEGDTNNVGDLFVHDRMTGETTRVSVDSSGMQSIGFIRSSSISADGRFVAFDSSAGTLVEGDTNGLFDVFVHDRMSGGTTRVSVDSMGTQVDDSSGRPSLTADGRFVAFDSLAANLVEEDTNGFIDIFVHDRETGETTRSGMEGNENSFAPSVSADGRFVAFDSSAANLVEGDSNRQPDVFVHDRLGTPTVVDEPSHVFVQFLSGEALGVSNKARIVLRNNRAITSSGFVLFKNPAGGPLQVLIGGELLEQVDFSLPPWGSLEIETDGTGELVTGVAEVLLSDGNPPASMSESTFEATEILDLLGNFVSVDGVSLGDRFQSYVSFTEKENSGIGIYNPSRDVLQLQLILLDQQGAEKVSRNLFLDPGQQLLSFVDETSLFANFFSGVESFKGTLNVSSAGSEKFGLIGLIQNRSNGALVAVKVSQSAFIR